MTTTLQPMTALTPLDLTPVHPTLATFEQLETELSQVLLERQEAIHTALLALLAREHLILVGPPGTAKSRLIAQLAHQIRTSQGGSLSCFHWLMTRFTTPEDLFGPVSLQGLHQDRYVRKTAGRLPTASLAFLDEVLRGSDPILETLLTLMQERLFDNDGQREPVPLLSLFGATNEVPASTEGKLSAVWDRFLFRVPVEYVSDRQFVPLLQLPPVQRISAQIQEVDLRQLQQLVPQVVVPDGIYELLSHLRRALLEQQVVISDRRWTQAITALQASALLSGHGLVEQGDLTVLKHVLWQRPEQRQVVVRALLRLIAPQESAILEKLDHAHSVMQALETTRRQSHDEDEELKAGMEAMGKLRSCARDLEQLRRHLLTQVQSTQRVDQALVEVKQMMTQVSEMIVSPAA